MIDTLESTIGKGIATGIPGFRYVKSRSMISRNVAAGWQGVTLGLIKTSNPEMLKLVAHAQIRIDALERIYAPFHIYLTEDDKRIHPTLSINCDELMPGFVHMDGFHTDEESVKSVIDSYTANLSNDVLPWLDRFSDEQELLEGLIEDDPKKWITSDRLVRYPVLLSLLYKKRDWSKFNKVSDDFKIYCSKPHNIVHLPFANMLVDGLLSLKTPPLSY